MKNSSHFSLRSWKSASIAILMILREVLFINLTLKCLICWYVSWFNTSTRFQVCNKILLMQWGWTTHSMTDLHCRNMRYFSLKQKKTIYFASSEPNNKISFSSKWFTEFTPIVYLMAQNDYSYVNWSYVNNGQLLTLTTFGQLLQFEADSRPKKC